MKQGTNTVHVQARTPILFSSPRQTFDLKLEGRQKLEGAALKTFASFKLFLLKLLLHLNLSSQSLPKLVLPKLVLPKILLSKLVISKLVLSKLVLEDPMHV